MWSFFLHLKITVVKTSTNRFWPLSRVGDVDESRLQPLNKDDDMNNTWWFVFLVEVMIITLHHSLKIK